MGGQTREPGHGSPSAGVLAKYGVELSAPPQRRSIWPKIVIFSRTMLEAELVAGRRSQSR